MITTKNKMWYATKTATKKTKMSDDDWGCRGVCKSTCSSHGVDPFRHTCHTFYPKKLYKHIPISLGKSHSGGIHIPKPKT